MNNKTLQRRRTSTHSLQGSVKDKILKAARQKVGFLCGRGTAVWYTERMMVQQRALWGAVDTCSQSVCNNAVAVSVTTTGI